MGVQRGLYLPVPQNFRPSAPPPPLPSPPLSITRSVLRDDARTTAAQKTVEETD